ncbi:MAG: CPBP family glutamic-type intramembrane protease [Candidatus Bathyarchaeia archaeon]|jgi:membrane protease YdiL (CAAX protease family)|nr:CPBP family glutamic-type intramembrane protease [Candidatus Bathyarchaeota archaeon]
MQNVDESLRRLLGSLLFALVLFLIATYFIAMVLGPLVFFSTADGLSVSHRTISRLPIIVFGAYAVVNVEMNVGLFFLGIWLIFFACFFMALEVRENIFVSLGNLSRGGIITSFRNYLLFMPFAASFSLVSVILLEWFLSLFGLSVGAPSVPGSGAPGEFRQFLFFLEVSYAPIVEEIGFRVIPLGVFLVVYLLLVKSQGRGQVGGCSWKSLVIAPFFPYKAKRECGLESVDGKGLLKGISVGEWVVIGVAAVVFGLAHYPLGSWGPAKFFSATLVGVVLGVVYFAYGFVAPILLHWFFNYYFNVFSLASDYFVMLSPLMFLAYFVNVLFGFFILAIVVFVSVKRFERVKRKTSQTT